MNVLFYLGYKIILNSLYSFLLRPAYLLSLEVFLSLAFILLLFILGNRY